MIESITPVLVDEMPKELTLAVTEAGLPVESAGGLLSEFKPMFVEANRLANLAKELAVTDATQVTEIKASRDLRLELREIRIKAEKKKTELKKESLLRGNAIQGLYNVLAYLVEPLEAKLKENEDFAVRAEAKRKEELKLTREKTVRELGGDPAMYLLGEMKEDAFIQLTNGIRLAAEAKIAADKKAAEELAAKQKADADERERVRLENERLKKEAADKEEALKKEREEAAEKARVAAEQAAEAKRIADEKAAKEKAELEKQLAEQKKAADEKAEKERAEKKRLQDELDAANKKAADAEAERKALELRKKVDEEAAKKKEDDRIAAEELAKKKSELAPEREKLAAFAAVVRSLPRPVLTSDEGKMAAIVIDQQIEKFALFIEQKAGAL